MIKRRSDLDRRFIVLSFVEMTANRKKGWIVIAKGKYHYWLTEDISDTLKNNKDIIDRKVENALLENALGSRQVKTIEEAVKDPDTGKSVEQLKALFIIAANETIDSDGEYYKVAGKKPEKLDTSKNLQKVLNSGMKQTGKTFKNLTRTTAGTSAAAFIKALDRAWMQISTGAFDHDTAIRIAIKTLSEKGLQTINYGSGKKTSIEAAVRRALLTGLNQTALHLQETLAEEMENDLVEVTAHSGARPDHAKWQGGIYSLYGRSKKFERERIAEDINKNSRKSIENTDKSSTIKPTKVISGHSGTPKKAEPNAVIDHTDKMAKLTQEAFMVMMA